MILCSTTSQKNTRNTISTNSITDNLTPINMLSNPTMNIMLSRISLQHYIKNSPAMNSLNNTTKSSISKQKIIHSHSKPSQRATISPKKSIRTMPIQFKYN